MYNSLKKKERKKEIKPRQPTAMYRLLEMLSSFTSRGCCLLMLVVYFAGQGCGKELLGLPITQ